MSDEEFYVHPTALVASKDIGRATRIWAFCNVGQTARIGAECNICDHCYIEDNVVIGNRVTIKNAVALFDGVVVEDDVFIGPNAVFTNDVRPRSRVRKESFDRTLIKRGATIGANAVIVAGNTIGRYAFIGAGAVITKDVPDFTMWYGNPARFSSYICRCTRTLDAADSSSPITCDCGLRFKFQDGQLSEQ
ncbi:MAG: N-acetyltransferase [Candidatus Zixiibacteriota bacterium]|nr:MAG: N-acetyltransferase [candidate division Zixibacteria bacterium]